jgi:hypothetical protein
MLDEQQALPGDGVQEVVELVLGCSVLCKGTFCYCEINARLLFPEWWQNDPRKIIQESNWKIDKMSNA